MSKVIKPNFYIPVDDKKTIQVADLAAAALLKQKKFAEAPHPEVSQEIREAERMKEQILRDAESFAEEQIRQAMEEAAALREQAISEIEDWWREKRTEDEQVMEAAREKGYEEGYRQGYEQGQEEIRQESLHMLQEAKSILEQAYLQKQQIIRESEPFLIELATSVAEKILQRELTLSPEWVVQMTKTVLSRKREKGLITLCVSPKYYAYIQDARDELLLAVDSQAELQILPDATVRDHGCVVRTEFGSIDARVDTQLKEIKHALQQLAMRSEAEEDDE